ncbi:citrate/2-methylcitrate synthase, partial [Staphylococcus epidermidis]|uniref:citrate/2-methylcitrate synthase n=1 Tax=Staphylococcus epidermidis TaxID=1282 RepID=UPI0037DA1C01
MIPELKRRLQPLIPAETKITSIIHTHLTYPPYHIHHLPQNPQFQQIIFLLSNYTLPNQNHLTQLKQKLFHYITLNNTLYNHFHHY